MNPDQEFESIEREYRRIKPAQPSARLRRRLESVVSMTPLEPASEILGNVVAPPRGIWSRSWFHSAAAALIGAAAVLAFAQLNSGTPEVAENPGPTPDSTSGPITPTFPLKTPSTTTVGTGNFQLTGQENRVFKSHDEGIVFSRDEIPFRRVRYNAVDRRIYIDPKTGAVVEFVVPREDVLIVPAETF